MKDRYINDLLARQAYITKNMPKKDPFDKGIMRAVQSARKSLAMDEEQEDAALRNSILTFGEEMHKMPKTRGFMSNFAQVGRALSPAIKTHDAYEEEAKDKNMKMLQYAQALRAAEEAKIDNLEYQAYLREHADKVLAEQKNYHQQSILARFAEAAKKDSESQFADYQGLPYRKLDKVGQRQADALKSITSANKFKLHDIDKALQALEKETKDNMFRPIGGLSDITNPVKDVVGRVLGNDKLTKETALRKSFYSQLGQLRATAERMTDGGGKLGQGMYDRLRPFFPNEDDDYLTLKTKLANFKREVEAFNKVAKISSDKGIVFDIGDLPEEHNDHEIATPQDDGVGQEEWISIISPSGRKEEVYYEDVPKLLKIPGYKRAE